MIILCVCHVTFHLYCCALLNLAVKCATTLHPNHWTISVQFLAFSPTLSFHIKLEVCSNLWLWDFQNVDWQFLHSYLIFYPFWNFPDPISILYPLHLAQYISYHYDIRLRLNPSSLPSIRHPPNSSVISRDKTIPNTTCPVFYPLSTFNHITHLIMHTKYTEFSPNFAPKIRPICDVFAAKRETCVCYNIINEFSTPVC